MIPLFLLLLVVCVLAVEYRHPDRCLGNLIYQNELDRELAEPDQIVSLRCTLRNVGRLPIFFIDLMEMLPEGLRPEEDEAWRRRHLQKLSGRLGCSSHLYLLPHRNYTRSFRPLLSDGRGLPGLVQLLSGRTDEPKDRRHAPALGGPADGADPGRLSG